MNDKFDELAKRLAQSMTRKQALKRFGVGLVGMAAACFGLSSTGKADKGSCVQTPGQCGGSGQTGLPPCSKCCSGSYNCNRPPNESDRECFCA